MGRRIFSHDNDTNFNDYLSNKKNIQIINNLKSLKKLNKNYLVVNNNDIISYLSYNDFLLLSKTFYKNSNLIFSNCKSPESIVDGKTSFICNKNTVNHKKKCDNCDECSRCDDCSSCDDCRSCDSCNSCNKCCKCKKHENYNTCETNKTILYPYGNYDNKKNNNFVFPNNISLNNWCSICKIENCICVKKPYVDCCKKKKCDDCDCEDNYEYKYHYSCKNDILACSNNKITCKDMSENKYHNRKKTNKKDCGVCGKTSKLFI